MPVSSQQISEVRAFNRDYTRRIGVLSQGLLDSPYSLTQVRVMYEIAHRPGITAGELGAELGLDRGYLSRILRRFHTQRLLARTTPAQDARRRQLRLTPLGRRVFAPLERRSQQQVRSMLSPLDHSRRSAVLEAMSTLRTVFTPGDRRAKVTLRTHRPGDIGWVVERHGALYAEEYGWDVSFEGLVAKIAGAFLEKNDPRVERAFIAERDGVRLGSVFLVRGSKQVARLRLLLVEPEARGMGLGKRLVEECVRFARESGYRKIVLWTQRNLLAARAIYRGTGFRKTGEERH